MVYKCCVPGCKGNYSSDGKKVSVFSFPKNEELKRKWIRAIHRDNFTPTHNSKVCEEHFKSHEIQKSVSMYDDRNAKLVTAPLSIPRLVEGAIPSQFPGLPSYLSEEPCSSREDPETKRFPKNPDVRREWISACGISHTFNIDSGVIFSDHFTPTDFKRNLKAELLNYIPKQRFLQENVIPTKNLPVSISELKLKESHTVCQKKKVKTMGRKCCVPGCKSNYDSTLRLLRPDQRHGISTFSFPKDEVLKQAWLQAIGRENWTPSQFTVVCKKHFNKEDIILEEFWKQPDGTVRMLPLKKAKLVKGAIPCKFKTLSSDDPTLNVYDSDMSEDEQISRSSDVTDTGGMSSKCDIQYLGTVPSNVEDSFSSNEKGPIQKLSSHELEELWKNEVGSICRLCANPDPECVPLFKKTETNIDLQTDIQKFLQLQVQEDDELPDTVCPSCLAAITAWHEFFHSCSAAEKQLQNTLESKKKEIFPLENDSQNKQKLLTTKQEVMESPKLGRKRSLPNEKSSTVNPEDQDVIFVSEVKKSGNKKIRVKAPEELFSYLKLQNSPDKNNSTLNNKIPVKCGICMKEFPNYVTVANHIMAKHNVGPNQCRYCSTTFKDSTSLKIHERNCKLDTLNKLKNSSKKQQNSSSSKSDSSSLGLICVQVYPDGKTQEKVLKSSRQKHAPNRNGTKTLNAKQVSKEKVTLRSKVAETGKRKVNLKPSKAKKQSVSTSSSRPYECYMCLRDFTTADHLSKHLACHVKIAQCS